MLRNYIPRHYTRQDAALGQRAGMSLDEGADSAQERKRLLKARRAGAVGLLRYRLRVAPPSTSLTATGVTSQESVFEQLGIRVRVSRRAATEEYERLSIV